MISTPANINVAKVINKATIDVHTDFLPQPDINLRKSFVYYNMFEGILTFQRQVSDFVERFLKQFTLRKGIILQESQSLLTEKKNEDS